MNTVITLLRKFILLLLYRFIFYYQPFEGLFLFFLAAFSNHLSKSTVSSRSSRFELIPAFNFLTSTNDHQKQKKIKQKKF